MAKATRRKTEPAPVVQDQPVVDQTPVTTEEQIETNVTGQPAATEPEPPKTEPAPATNNGQQPVVTQEVVVARMKAELTKLKYEEALQKFTDLKVTADTMQAVQLELKKMRGFLRDMDAIKVAGKKPALERCRMWDNAYNQLSDLLEAELSKKQILLNKVAKEETEKAEKARKEQQRKDDIKKSIDDFILQQSQAIASAKTDDELVTIQKLIGSNKANKSRYEEFLPSLVERCDELTPIINKQKEAIRELRKLEEDKLAAEKKGDDAALIAIEERKEQVSATLDEQKVLIQETAINQATKTTDVIVAEPVISTIKARRTKWKGELKTDAKSLRAALDAGLLKPVIDPDKLEVLIDTLKQTKQLEGKKEFEINGVRLYLEELY